MVAAEFQLYGQLGLVALALIISIGNRVEGAKGRCSDSAARAFD